MQKCHHQLAAEFRNNVVSISNALMLEGVLPWDEYLYVLGDSLPTSDKGNMLLVHLQGKINNNPVSYARFMDIISKSNLNRSKNCLLNKYTKLSCK